MPEATDEVQVKVTAPIQKGSIVLVSDLVDSEEMPRLMTSLRHITGHEKFLIIQMGGGQGFSIHGSDEVRDAVRALVREEFDNLLKEIRARGN